MPQSSVYIRRVRTVATHRLRRMPALALLAACLVACLAAGCAGESGSGPAVTDSAPRAAEPAPAPTVARIADAHSGRRGHPLR